MDDRRWGALGLRLQVFVMQAVSFVVPAMGLRGAPVCDGGGCGFALFVFVLPTVGLALALPFMLFGGVGRAGRAGRAGRREVAGWSIWLGALLLSVALGRAP